MRAARCLLLALALAPALAGAGGAEEEGWKKERDENGIQMYTRAVEGWTIREIRGVTKVKVPLQSLVAVFQDVSTAIELNDMVKESRVVDRESDTRYRTYAAMDMPWPVGDRDIVNQRTVTKDARTGVVIIEDVAITDGVPPREGFVRMVKSRQTWTLTPASEGETDVELRVLADPNGPIPASLINSMSIDKPFATLSRLEKVAQKKGEAR